MSCPNIQVNDIGTALVVTISEDGTALNISSATTMTIIIQKPDGSILSKTASFYTDGTDGKMVYVTTSGDIDLAGIYQIQAYVVFSGGSFYTTIDQFTVNENLS